MGPGWGTLIPAAAWLRQRLLRAKASLGEPAETPRNTAMNELLSPAFTARLRTLAAEKAAEYRANVPFPNIVFDDFLPSKTVEAALRDFPQPQQLPWRGFASPNQVKLGFGTAEDLSESIRKILYFFNSRPVLEFLEELTGILGLIPDPYFLGGGLHQVKCGGFLQVHADFNRQPKLKLDRRINLLLYLNQDWKEEYGGHLELWKPDMSAAVHKILPIFNRCAIFNTSPTSYHGHPVPLACPPECTRKSLALYYYTNGRPQEEMRDEHSTMWQRTGTRQGAIGPDLEGPLTERGGVTGIWASIAKRIRSRLDF
jgi:Rps23 Pro-64 3,4-dihydroxylase Tpa1-like proline 4-hydroxylase